MKKRDLVVMWLFGLLTLGIYSFFATLSILKGFYKLSNNEQAFKKRMAQWGIMYLGLIVSFIATIALAYYGYGFFGFIASVGLFMILMMMIMMCVAEFAVVTKVANDNGVKTRQSYMYIVPCLAYNNFVIISLVLQTKLNKILEEKAGSEIVDKVTE